MILEPTNTELRLTRYGQDCIDARSWCTLYTALAALSITLWFEGAPTLLLWIALVILIPADIIWGCVGYMAEKDHNSEMRHSMMTTGWHPVHGTTR